MSAYNHFDPKHYKGDYGVLQISEEEAKSYLEFRLNEISRAESIVLSKENIEEHSISDKAQLSFRASYESRRKTVKKEFEMMKRLGFKVYALVDYYLKRYFNLKQYEKVGFALSGSLDGNHSVDEIAREMLLFVKDRSAIEQLEVYLNNKERRCQK